MRSISMLLLAGVATLSTSSHAKGQGNATPSQRQTQQATAPQGTPDWRERMQRSHNADSSIAQQVRRLTRDLSLTSQQQEQVRLLSKAHKSMVGRLDSGTEARHAP